MQERGRRRTLRRRNASTLRWRIRITGRLKGRRGMGQGCPAVGMSLCEAEKRLRDGRRAIDQQIASCRHEKRFGEHCERWMHRRGELQSWTALKPHHIRGRRGRSRGSAVRFYAGLYMISRQQGYAKNNQTGEKSTKSQRSHSKYPDRQHSRRACKSMQTS